MITCQLKNNYSIKRKSKFSVLLLIFYNFYNLYIIKLLDLLKMNSSVLTNLNKIMFFLLIFIRMDELESFSSMRFFIG